ncbi:MAG: EVE domain-containing protein [Gammaproteobacteria bacterium]
MHHWLLKTEPDEFSWDDLCARGAAGEPWTGVRNHQAAKFLRQMAVGDSAYVYHTGNERRLVGVAEIVRAHYPDPGDASGRFVAVDVRAVAALAAPVTLAAIKAEPALADFLLVRQSRLSVMPVTAAERRVLERLARA